MILRHANLRNVAFGVLIFACVSLLAETILDRSLRMQLWGSIGYGDAYILASVHDLERTGVLYPPVPKSDGAPVLYSPLLYYLVWVGERLSPSGHPNFGPRFVFFLAYLAALSMAARIAGQLVPHRRVVLYATFWIASLATVRDWILQLRGDFAGIFFSLASTSLLMTWFEHPRVRWLIAAGACAGLATQFKITFLAAGAAGLGWLAWRRDWRALVPYASAAAVFSMGGYAFFLYLEPHLLENILALTNTINTWQNMGDFAKRIAQQPAIALACCGLPLVAVAIKRTGHGKWSLLGLHLVLSLFVALPTARQAGAAVNYFYETMFALSPLMAWGAFRLAHEITPNASVFAGTLLAIHSLRPVPTSFPGIYRSTASYVFEENDRYEKLVHLFQHFDGLSFVPEFNSLTARKELPEPYLMSYRRLLGLHDFSPLVKRIEQRQYDFILALPAQSVYRGIPHAAAEVNSAISDRYVKHCEAGRYVIWLPPEPREDLRESLRDFLCSAGAAPTDGK